MFKMFNGRRIEGMEVKYVQGSPKALTIKLSDGTDFLIVSDSALDFYSVDKESLRTGWIHPENLNK